MTVLFSKIVDGLATWFGCGLSPKAPGTAGTLGAIPLLWAFTYFEPVQYMVAVLLFSALSIFVAHFYQSPNEHDPQEFVMDEVAGFLVAMTWVPFTITGVAAGFFLFRLFDIWKPFPIRWLDRNIKGGVGIVADDLAAGIVANGILQLLLQNGVKL